MWVACLKKLVFKSEDDKFKFKELSDKGERLASEFYEKIKGRLVEFVELKECSAYDVFVLREIYDYFKTDDVEKFVKACALTPYFRNFVDGLEDIDEGLALTKELFRYMLPSDWVVDMKNDIDMLKNEMDKKYKEHEHFEELKHDGNFNEMNKTFSKLAILDAFLTRLSFMFSVEDKGNDEQ